jgi:DNA-binding NarL/FixJ family response regulator
MTTAPAPITPLTPALKLVTQYLVRGESTDSIATAMNLSKATVRGYLGEIRQNLHCPPRCSAAVLVHAILTHRQVDLSEHTCPAPELTDSERRLLRAVATHSRWRDMAHAAGVPTSDVCTSVDALVDKAGATDSVHLVRLAHAWNLLTATDKTAPCRPARGETVGAAQ